MNVLDWALKRSQEKGIVQTIKIACNVISDLFFDWRYGTDTMRWLDRDRLNAGSKNQLHSAPYRATKVKPFLRLLKSLDLPRDCNFVDIGSGKGRVLLMASLYGFRKVVGIEFAAQLCSIARKNVELFGRKKQRILPIEVIEADATQYRFHDEDRVFFMYNPFDSYIMRQVVDNIHRSLQEHPRHIWLIYNTPLHHEVIKAAGFFKTDLFFEIGGNHFRVYSN